LFPPKFLYTYCSVGYRNLEDSDATVLLREHPVAFAEERPLCRLFVDADLKLGISLWFIIFSLLNGMCEHKGCECANTSAHVLRMRAHS
jgi:hypothetical protein